jgi:DNA excision repair protein ERCC-6
MKMKDLTKRLHSLSPEEVFEQLANDSIYEYIVKETVRYAVNVKNEQDFMLTADEVRVFLGFLLLTGYHKLTSERLYWSQDEDLGLEIVKKAMSRNKYKKLKSMIRFQDNDLVNENKYDRGFKIRPLMEMINFAFQQFGIFEEFLTVDEMIVKYYGHNSLKQFIRGKPIMFGYKLWALCGTSGYCFSFSLHCGKAPSNNERGDLLLGSKVVLNIVYFVEHPNSHSVFSDNAFKNRDILIHLRFLGYRATGTIRENRTGDCPLKSSKEIKMQDRGTFDCQYDRNGDVLFVRWNDNKCVTMGANFDTIDPLVAVTRRNRGMNQTVGISQPRVLKT